MLKPIGRFNYRALKEIETAIFHRLALSVLAIDRVVLSRLLTTLVTVPLHKEPVGTKNSYQHFDSFKATEMRNPFWLPWILPLRVSQSWRIWQRHVLPW